MTPPSLPGREEIVEVIGPFCRAIHGGPKWSEACHQHMAMADALLARLRPAFDEARREGAYVEASKEMPAVDALVKVAAERDALRADLAACVAALTQALLPLEALNASVQWELSPPVMGVIAEAIASGRAALARVTHD